LESLSKAIWPFSAVLVSVLFLVAYFPQNAMIVRKIFKIGV
jgi:TRAP-type C4-dicarboxylate transport system permease large subunit